MGRAPCGIGDIRRAVAPVRACAESPRGLFCPHQARRNSLAIFNRSFGFRGIDQDIREQRGVAIPGIDRGHHSDAVPELATRRRGAAGLSNHADRSAHPDTEGGSGELRTEAQ